MPGLEAERLAVRYPQIVHLHVFELPRRSLRWGTTNRYTQDNSVAGEAIVFYDVVTTLDRYSEAHVTEPVVLNAVAVGVVMKASSGRVDRPIAALYRFEIDTLTGRHPDATRLIGERIVENGVVVAALPARRTSELSAIPIEEDATAAAVAESIVDNAIVARAVDCDRLADAPRPLPAISLETVVLDGHPVRELDIDRNTLISLEGRAADRHVPHVGTYIYAPSDVAAKDAVLDDDLEGAEMFRVGFDVRTETRRDVDANASPVVDTRSPTALCLVVAVAAIILEHAVAYHYIPGR